MTGVHNNGLMQNYLQLHSAETPKGNHLHYTVDEIFV